MILIKLIRWMLGYVKIEAWYGFKERFLNLCAMSHTPLWDVKNSGDSLTASTTVQGYKAMRKIVKKSQMKIKIIKRTGLPFIINKNKKRFGFLIGAVLMIVIISVLSTMIWTIDVKGNVNVTDDEIIAVFQELGVKVGCFKKKLDVDLIEIEASQRLRKLSWLSLNINGSRAIIEVREAKTIPDTIDSKAPCNVIANYDGQIIKYEVYAGKAEQEMNAAVLKGDLLISGIIENQDLTERLVHAKGKIIASTERKIQGKCYSTQFVTRVTGIKKAPQIYFLGIKIPLWYNANKEHGRLLENEYLLNTDTARLPVGIIKREWIATSQKKEIISAEKRRLIAINNYFSDEAQQAMNADIISQKVEIVENENNTEILGILKCEEQIGVEQEIFIDKNLN